MDDARPTWVEALDLALKVSRITADQKAQAASKFAGRTDVSPATLAEAVGVPIEAMEALFRLAMAPSADPAAVMLRNDRGVSDLVVDMLDDDAKTPPLDAPSPRPVRLTLEALDAPAGRWQFTGPCLVQVGRSRSAQVHLDDIHVTGNHAEIEVSAAGCRVRDLSSANHTFVNGERVETRELAEGDEVRVGRTRLKVSIHVPTGSTTISHKKEEDPEIPGYIIEQRIGNGGMARVFLARELDGHLRRVAVKTYCLPCLLSELEADFRAKLFMREMATAALFHHPNVIEVYNSGVAGRTLWMAMEFAEGGDLGSYLRDHGPLPCEVACRWMLQALEGMAAAHERKVVHRDLKPENLLLTRAAADAEVKVADLGLAKNFETSGLSGITQSGAWAGTFDYVAPDQVSDYKYTTPAADVWSLGVVLFRMLTGKGLYDGEGDQAKRQEMIFTAPIPRVDSLRPDVQSAVADVVERALQRETARRYADAREMREALRTTMA